MNVVGARLLGLAAAAATVLGPIGAAVAGDRWPVWPTEVSHVAAPLRSQDLQGTSERQRMRAVGLLEQFAAEAIADEVVAGLRDPSPTVRRELLRICHAHAIEACVPAAAALWADSRDIGVRRAALLVLSLDPAPTRIAILVEALRDSSDQIRAGAAEFLGRAPLAGDQREQVRNALIAKLSDVSAAVRRDAVESLGLLAPGTGSLAIARLLEDPDPTVRAAAATALGHHGEASVVPALARVVAGGNETQVVLAAANALAILPGDRVTEVLLGLLDDPPRGLGRQQIASAIGLRPDPDGALIDGLVARLREANVSEAALLALLMLGEPTQGALRRALARGLEPHLEVEVRRLLAALDLPTAPVVDSPALPGLGARGRWHDRLASGDHERVYAAARALAKASPLWLSDAIAGALDGPHPGDQALTWLAILAMARRPLLRAPGHALTWTAIEGWSRNPAVDPGARCAAIVALGAASTPRARRRAVATLTELGADPNPDARTCAAFALARFGDSGPTLLAATLHDPDPRARTAAALSLATMDPSRVAGEVRSALALAAHRDPEQSVRLAARHALRALAEVVRRDPRPRWLAFPPTSVPWAEPLLMAPVVLQSGDRLLVPAFAGPGPRQALVPGLWDATVEIRPPSASLVSTHGGSTQ